MLLSYMLRRLFRLRIITESHCSVFPPNEMHKEFIAIVLELQTQKICRGSPYWKRQPTVAGLVTMPDILRSYVGPYHSKCKGDDSRSTSLTMSWALGAVRHASSTSLLCNTCNKKMNLPHWHSEKCLFKSNALPLISTLWIFAIHRRPNDTTVTYCCGYSGAHFPTLWSFVQ